MTSASLNLWTTPTRHWSPTPALGPATTTAAGTALPAARLEPTVAPEVDTAPTTVPPRPILDMSALRVIRDLLTLATQVENSETGFRPGFDDPYRIKLQQLLLTSSGLTLPMLAQRLVYATPGVRAATLRYVAELQLGDTVHQVRFVLPFLFDVHPDVRDAAATALIDLHSLFALPTLRTALDQESSPSVAETMRQAIDCLQQLLPQP